MGRSAGVGRNRFSDHVGEVSQSTHYYTGQSLDKRVSRSSHVTSMAGATFSGTRTAIFVTCQYGCMALTISPRRGSVFAIVLFLSVASRSVGAQPPAPLPPQGTTDQLELTAAEEKDSYEIYSILLRTEMPPQWDITGWAITQETQTFPSDGTPNGRGPGSCLQPPLDQRSVYLPLIEDYVAKNKKKLILKRKFDLPQFALIGLTETKAIQERWQPRAASSNSGDAFPLNATVIFQVSAVGFNSDRTRALVYVGHNCGGLCGGGRYHLLVKKDGQWQVDRGYRGGSCGWAS